MKDLLNARLLIALFICLLFCCGLHSQEPNCLETLAVGAMARANTVTALKARRQKAGNSYRSQLVFAARMLEIDPKNEKAAASLLSLLPKDEDGPEQSVWLSLDQLEQCPSGGIPDIDLNPLFQLQERLPRDAATAALLIPNRMFDYVSYAPIATESVVNDYALQMRKVCRARHNQFVEAVNRLSPKEKNLFVLHVFNPDGCRAIAIPEL
jgi:hypothetical protein